MSLLLDTQGLKGWARFKFDHLVCFSIWHEFQSRSVFYTLSILFCQFGKAVWTMWRVGAVVVATIQNKRRTPAKSTIFCPSNLNKYWAVKHFAKIYARLFDQLSTKCPNLNMNFTQRNVFLFYNLLSKLEMEISRIDWLNSKCWLNIWMFWDLNTS